jgi:hypothetical protein
MSEYIRFVRTNTLQTNVTKLILWNWMMCSGISVVLSSEFLFEKNDGIIIESDF